MRRLLGILTCLITFVVAVGGANGQVGNTLFDTKAKFAVLMDYESGMVLYQKNADEHMQPASMAKLMTLAVVFNALRNGSLSLDDKFVISEHAWRAGGAASGGSTMFAKLGSEVSVADLLRGVIVQSGNDAAIALAEGIAGTEATFANMENQLAKKIGLTSSHFTDASGLPEPGLYTTARDLANLARYLIREFPQYYPMFAETEFTWNKIRQRNRNTLLELNIGVDGLKTGHSEASGYGIVASSKEGGRRLIAVLNGMSSARERTEEARKLLQWGTRGFERLPVYPKGKIVAYANVYGGEKPQVGLVGKNAIEFFIPKGASDCPEASVVYTGPLRPPVEKGDRVAELKVMCNNQLVQSTPLYAAETVGQGDLPRRAIDALKQLALGWL